MKAREEALRYIADGIERDRDPSHVRCLSEKEFRKLFEEKKIDISFCEAIHIPVKLEAWMDVTKVGEKARTEIRRKMQEELSGGQKTGFEPYLKDEEITFDHRWMLMTGIKMTAE